MSAAARLAALKAAPKLEVHVAGEKPLRDRVAITRWAKRVVAGVGVAVALGAAVGGHAPPNNGSVFTEVVELGRWVRQRSMELQKEMVSRIAPHATKADAALVGSVVSQVDDLNVTLLDRGEHLRVEAGNVDQANAANFLNAARAEDPDRGAFTYVPGEVRPGDFGVAASRGTPQCYIVLDPQHELGLKHEFVVLHETGHCLLRTATQSDSLGETFPRSRVEPMTVQDRTHYDESVADVFGALTSVQKGLLQISDLDNIMQIRTGRAAADPEHDTHASVAGLKARLVAAQGNPAAWNTLLGASTSDVLRIAVDVVRNSPDFAKGSDFDRRQDLRMRLQGIAQQVKGGGFSMAETRDAVHLALSSAAGVKVAPENYSTSLNRMVGLLGPAANRTDFMNVMDSPAFEAADAIVGQFIKESGICAAQAKCEVDVSSTRLSAALQGANRLMSLTHAPKTVPKQRIGPGRA